MMIGKYVYDQFSGRILGELASYLLAQGFDIAEDDFG